MEEREERPGVRRRSIVRAGRLVVIGQRYELLWNREIMRVISSRQDSRTSSRRSSPNPEQRFCVAPVLMLLLQISSYVALGAL